MLQKLTLSIKKKKTALLMKSSPNGLKEYRQAIQLSS